MHLPQRVRVCICDSVRVRQLTQMHIAFHINNNTAAAADAAAAIDDIINWQPYASSCNNNNNQPSTDTSLSEIRVKC